KNIDAAPAGEPEINQIGTFAETAQSGASLRACRHDFAGQLPFEAAIGEASCHTAIGVHSELGAEPAGETAFDIDDSAKPAAILAGPAQRCMIAVERSGTGPGDFRVHERIRISPTR